MLSKTYKAWAEWGYVQRCANTGERAVGELMTASNSGREFRLIALVADYLDVRLIPMIKLVRHISDLPLLILTTEYQAKTKNDALILGADRYLPIPATIDEGILSGLALIRMSERLTGICQDHDAILLPHDFYISMEQRRACIKNHEIHLTRKEFDLLWFFAANHDIMLSYATIYERVWGGEYYEDANWTIWTTVKHLRDKLGIVSPLHDFIRSERYTGYRFCV